MNMNKIAKIITLFITLFSYDFEKRWQKKKAVFIFLFFFFFSYIFFFFSKFEEAIKLEGKVLLSKLTQKKHAKGSNSQRVVWSFSQNT